jgi:ATP-binding cassette, subfamily C, bacterial exporter for protease/lipase
MSTKYKSIWVTSGVAGSIRRAFAIVLLFSFFLNLLVLASPVYMMQVYDRVLVSGRVDTLIYVSLIIAAAFVALGLLEATRSYILTRLGRYLDQVLRDKVLSQAIATSRRGAAGQRRLIEDLATMRNYLGSAAVLPFMDAPWAPFFLLLIAMMHPWLGVFALGSAIILFCLALANDYFVREPLRAATDKQFVATDMANAALVNADAIHAMGMNDAISRRYQKQVEEAGAAAQTAADVGSWITSASKALRIAVQSGVLGLGAYLVINAQMTPGGMIAASILLGRALSPIEQSIGAWKQFVNARDSYGNVRKFLSSIPDLPPRIELPDISGHVSVRDVAFRLSGADEPIVRRASFDLQPGSAMALVGPSASGKSTLCRLLVGSIAPLAGSVRVDGADITSLNPSDMARTIGYLPQSVEVFSGTVKENIARMGAVDDAAVVEAARMAGCHDMILKLRDGYETELGPRGSFLSGGQRQRIGLARALYGRPKVLVLDEPNSNLDQEGEVALVDAIARAKAAGSTVIVVSHRMSLLKPIDKLGVMRDGVLEKFGDRDEVLREINPPPQPRPTLVAGEAFQMTASVRSP